MPLIEVAIPHLLGGVSQQPPAGRQPGQVEACDNALLHPVNGLAKRPGTRHLGKLLDGLESVRLAHWINRDSVERYLVLLGERRVRVFSAEDGAEFQVKVNGTATNAGRGRIGTGTPLNYLDPRTPGGVVDQDEDFVIGAGDWLSTAGNSVTSYISDRGPFNFGRRESLTTVNADTVAEVGNAGAATVSDIYQDFGLFARITAFSVFAKKSSSAITDFELALINLAPALTFAVRFDIDSAGVITVGSGVGGNVYAATAEDYGNGWYRCTMYLSDRVQDTVQPIEGQTRRLRIRFHTVGANPENKRLLLFGARCHDIRSFGGELGLGAGPLILTDTAPPYVHERPDLFKALTIADSTLLLNTEVTAAMAATDTADNALDSYFWVRTGGLDDVRYEVTIHYTTATVPASVSYNVQTTAATARTDDDIAEGLRTQIDAHADLVAVRFGSVVRITHASGAAGNAIRFIEVFDSRGDELMVAITPDPTYTLVAPGGNYVCSVRRFTDLPLVYQHDQVVLIKGDLSSSVDDFYVKFRGRSGSGLGHGSWEEAPRPGVTLTATGLLTSFDRATMPQNLTRRQDNATGTITGTPNAIYFDVSQAAWDDRLVGDELSNPEPAFVGEAINDLFLFRGRLGFLARDSMILSEAGEIFNFWRTTVRSLPDTEPIELTSLTQADELLSAVATADVLIVSSDRRQFQLVAEPALTPATAQLTPLRAFDLLAIARPVDTGRGVVFARLDGANTGLMEVGLRGDEQIPRFEELTQQAPRYIAGAALELGHSSLTGLTAVRAADPTIVYLHQSLLDADEARLQSAAHRWTFHSDTLVRGLAFFGEVMKQAVERAEGWFLEEQPTGTELVETVEGAEHPLTHLDRRLAEDQLQLSYNGGTDETTITLPYEVPAGATMQVVDAATGLLVPIVSQTATTIVVSDDYTDSALFVGERFDLSVTLTRPEVREEVRGGALLPRMSHPVQVHRLTLYLAETAIIRVEVSRSLRTATAQEFTAAGLGTGLLGMGQLNQYTGRAAFGILATSTELACTLKNVTPFPSRIQAGRWECRQHSRAGTA